MMPRPNPAVPVDLQELSGRFEDWLRTQRGKVPMPEPLWAAAAELAEFRGKRSSISRESVHPFSSESDQRFHAKAITVFMRFRSENRVPERRCFSPWSFS